MCLARRFAHDYVLEEVLNLYQNPKTEARLKDALANVLIAICHKQDLPKLFPLVLDTAHADGRIPLLDVLKKFPSEDVVLEPTVGGKTGAEARVSCRKANA